MPPRIPTPHRIPTLCLALCSLLAASVLVHPTLLSAQSDRSGERVGLQIETFPRGLVDGDVFIVRLVEANPAAQRGRVTVAFLDDREEIVARQSSSFGPGLPATFSIARTELETGGRFPAVRAILRVQQEGGGHFTSQPVATFEVFNELTFTIERDPPCKPPSGDGSSQPQLSCECPEGLLTYFTAE